MYCIVTTCASGLSQVTRLGSCLLEQRLSPLQACWCCAIAVVALAAAARAPAAAAHLLLGAPDPRAWGEAAAEILAPLGQSCWEKTQAGHHTKLSELCHSSTKSVRGKYVRKQ